MRFGPHLCHSGGWLASVLATSAPTLNRFVLAHSSIITRVDSPPFDLLVVSTVEDLGLLKPAIVGRSPSLGSHSTDPPVSPASLARHGIRQEIPRQFLGWRIRRSAAYARSHTQNSTD